MTDLERLIDTFRIFKIRRAESKLDATPNSFMVITGSDFGIPGARTLVNLQEGKGSSELYTVFYFDRKGKFLAHAVLD